jgi:ATP-dependent exoDNAse (exonuclease V) alpha subunit
MLNNEQQGFINRVVAGEPSIILIGDAGTGKSYLVHELINSMPKTHIQVTATTNKAASIYQHITDTRTIHSFLGFRMQQNNKLGEYELAQVNPPGDADILIVDELSMLPNILLNAIEIAQARGVYKQVIYIGDPVQLPAVHDGIELSDLTGPVFELTQQMRFTFTDAEALAYLKDLRHAIEHTPDKMVPFRKSSIITCVDNFKEFAQLYHSTSGSKKIMAYLNDTVDRYNYRINGGVAFKVGDQVIIDKPFLEYWNGSTLEVASVDETDDYYKVLLTDGRDEDTAIHWKLKGTYDTLLNRLRKKKDWSTFWNVVDNSLRLKHKYACTIHKSQGSSYDTVFLDGRNLLSGWNNKIISTELFTRLLYVGLSRMRKQAYIYTGSEGKNYKFFTP